MPVVAKGYDYSFSHPSIASLQAAGAKFVCRYLCPPGPDVGSKLLTKPEADGLISHSLDIVSLFEWYASRASEGFAAGAVDARTGAAQHLAAGGRSNAPINFAVDYDADPTAVVPYIRGINSVIGVQRTGVYGSYRVCKYLMDMGLIGKSDTPGYFYAFQAYAWSAGQYDERCSLAQDKNGLSLGGGTVDLDSAHCADYGQWGYTPTGDDMSAADVKAINDHTDAQVNGLQAQLTDLSDRLHNFGLQSGGWAQGLDAHIGTSQAALTAGQKATPAAVIAAMPDPTPPLDAAEVARMILGQMPPQPATTLEMLTAALRDILATGVITVAPAPPAAT